MNNLIIFDLIITVLGVYLIASAWKMKKTGEINPILVNDEEMKKCSDPAGFIGKICKPMLLYGGISLVFGASALINATVLKLGRSFETAGMLLFLAASFWFFRRLRIQKIQYFS